MAKVGALFVGGFPADSSAAIRPWSVAMSALSAAMLPVGLPPAGGGFGAPPAGEGGGLGFADIPNLLPLLVVMMRLEVDGNES